MSTVTVRKNTMRTMGTQTVYDLLVNGERVAFVRKIEGIGVQLDSWRLRIIGAPDNTAHTFWTRREAVEYIERIIP